MSEAGEKQSELLRQAVADFRRAMELRGEVNLRVARRVTSILRIGMLSFAVISVIMVGMLFAFTSRVSDMIVVLDTMQTQFHSVSADMHEMGLAVHRMDSDMQGFPAVTSEMATMRANVSALNERLASITAKMAEAQDRMQTMTRNVGLMNDSFRALAPSVEAIGGDLDHAASPMRRANAFFPW